MVSLLFGVATAAALHSILITPALKRRCRAEKGRGNGNPNGQEPGATSFSGKITPFGA